MSTGSTTRLPHGKSFAFLSYDPDVPSFRYRIAPVVARLQAMGHDCQVLRMPSGRYVRRLCAVRNVLRAAAVVVVTKMNLTPPEPALLRRWSRRTALDFDDSIFVRRPRAPGLPPGESRWRRRKFAETCEVMDLVIAGNSTLAAAAAPHASRVEIVPTPVDVERYRISTVDPARPPTLVWLGRPENLDYLEMVRPALVRLARRWPSLRLRVICSEFPDWPDVAIERVAWTPANEVEGLASADIGLMPLVDDTWTRGKCAFKLIQYGAAGLASVGSAVGANPEAVIDGESGYLVAPGADWDQPLASLLESVERRAEFGRRARQHVERNFSTSVVSARAAALLERLAD
jgi:glycosyltransferase involved in cell wall biosynthesis